MAEWLLTLLALLLLLPGYLQLRELTPREARYGTESIGPPLQLPNTLLPALCPNLKQSGSDVLGQALCAPVTHWWHSAGKPLRTGEWPLLFERQLQGIADEFAGHARQQQAMVDQLQLRQQEGLLASDDSLLAEREALNRYVQRYQLLAVAPGLSTSGSFGAGALLPLPVQCLYPVVRRAHALLENEPAAARQQADLLLWLAAVLDGRPRLPQPDSALQYALGQAWQSHPEACNTLLADAGNSSHRRLLDSQEPAAVVALARQSAELLRLARESDAETYKADAMHNLLQQAWWQWPLWAVVALLLLKLARRPEVTPASGLGLTLLLWGAAGAGCEVFLPYTEKWDFYPRAVAGLPFSLPAWPLALMMLLGLALFLWARGQRNAYVWPQTLSSRTGFAGFVLLAGLGWLMLLDQSATGHVRNRYLALYQQGYLWGALLLLNITAMLRVPLGVFLARAYAFLMLLGGQTARWKSWLPLLLFVAVCFWSLRNQRQFTSELGRIGLIVGTAWFFYLRGDPLHQVAVDRSWRAQLAWFSPMLLVLLMLLLAMGITSDMGPLLISIYGTGIFLAAAVAAGRIRNGVTLGKALLMAGGIVICWAALVTESLFLFGDLNSTAAGRLESVYAPLAAMNDQMAVITWFRHAAPAWGYGIGAIPWCGQVGAGLCQGVPLQIQSDYTFTALWGVGGGGMAWGVLILATFWHYRLIKYHPDVTQGCPSLQRMGPAGTLMADPQGFLSWLCVGWVTLNLCQMAVTVSGNLGLLPLTGVTFPFVSYGMVSLWGNAVFLGIAININRPSGKINRAQTA